MLKMDFWHYSSLIWIKKRFKLKRRKIIGVATDIFGPELAEERKYEVVD